MSDGQTLRPMTYDKLLAALIDAKSALATAQAERYALLRSVDMEVTARRNAEAALTEARRVLRLVDKQARRECPVCFSPGWTHKEGCALAAVLAQEGQ